jgi:soluble lytic murein transglycosylase
MCHRIQNLFDAVMKRKLPLYLVMLGLISTTVLGQTLEEQRQLYTKAKKELRAGRVESFNSIAEQLKDYPLYPYLRFDYLSRNLWKTDADDMAHFFKEYADVPVTGDLRRSWLNYLSSRNRWSIFVEHYTPQSNEELQCKYLLGRVKLNQQALLLEDTRTMWLTGTSRPPECDAAFELLYKSDLMTDELVWQRIKLAMAEGQTRLATYLGKKLDRADREWVQRWVEVHNNPWSGTSKSNYDDVEIVREILVHGIHRLAMRDIKKAMERWPDLKRRYRFNDDQKFKVERRLAIRAVRYEHPGAISILSQVDNKRIDADLLQARIATALKNKDWELLLDWTSGPPAAENLSQRWYYWQARAQDEVGNKDKARDIYSLLAAERDYFGFSASDKLDMKYQMGHKHLPRDDEAWEKVENIPAIKRAKELFHLGSYYSARREWQRNLNKLNIYDMQIAANLAYEWGWHDRAILTLGKAQAYDDLNLRFPMPYKDKLIEYADKRQLDRAWVFALTRAESAFIEDVRSPSGALGLMQVMPATGKETAQKIGLKNFKAEQLKQSERNIPIGTAYLKQMYDRFNNNLILATAAYNAGPHNVGKWLPDDSCIEPDIWIAQIPFTETRKYVQRILYFSSIYDWRFEQDIKPVEIRAAGTMPVNKSSANKIASLSCQAQAVSMN